MSPLFQHALVYACRMHDGQWRKATKVPYFAHVMAVAAIALEYGATEEEAIGALLHDVVEDCGGPPRVAEIREKFGEAVVAIVLGCTDTDAFPKPPWQERKDRYIAHLPEASASTLLVSAADKLANARSIVSEYRVQGEQLWDRFSGGRRGTLWYYRTLADAFLRLRGDRLADELDRVVRTMESLAGAGRAPV
jgi:GTP pyrophosphokinase